MSREITYICNRCGAAILEDRSTLKFEHGARRHDEQIDLCPDCAERFGDFLRGPRQGPCNGVGATSGIPGAITR